MLFYDKGHSNCTTSNNTVKNALPLGDVGEVIYDDDKWEMLQKAIADQEMGLPTVAPVPDPNTFVGNESADRVFDVMYIYLERLQRILSLLSNGMNTFNKQRAGQEPLNLELDDIHFNMERLESIHSLLFNETKTLLKQFSKVISDNAKLHLRICSLNQHLDEKKKLPIPTCRKRHGYRRIYESDSGFGL
jgi:hypothetical protein